MSELDLLVIGAGSGGVRAARMAAASGARVIIAEEGRLGGTCVNRGCVPKKLLMYAAQMAESFVDATGFGFSCGRTRFDWPSLVEGVERELGRLNRVYRKLLEDAGVEVVVGRARVVGPHEVEVAGRSYRSQRILVATGGRPERLPVPGDELALTSDQAFHLDRLPERILIAGGGYIATEFASIFNALGSEVVQLYRGPLFLRGFDDDLRRQLAHELRTRGVDLRFDACIDEIRREDGDLEVADSRGDRHRVSHVLLAVGRRPNTADLGLEGVGVELDPRGAVVVDEWSRSTVPSIWAVGDVTDRVNLTPVAIEEAMAFVDTEIRGLPRTMDHSNVPTAVFGLPGIGAVGLTETEAIDRFGHQEVAVYRSTFRPMKHNLSGRDERSLMKLVVRRGDDRVLGVHVLGPDAAEIIQGFAVALKCGATKAQLDATVGVHPTAAEELVTMRTPVG